MSIISCGPNPSTKQHQQQQIQTKYQKEEKDCRPAVTLEYHQVWPNPPTKQHHQQQIHQNNKTKRKIVGQQEQKCHVGENPYILWRFEEPDSLALLNFPELSKNWPELDKDLLVKSIGKKDGYLTYEDILSLTSSKHSQDFLHLIVW